MKLRKWVEILLLIISFTMMLVLASDCENIIILIVSKIIAIAVMIINAYLIEKYGTIFNK